MHVCSCSAFLVRLRTSGSVVKNIGDILHTQIPLLMPHVRWCSCQLTACTLLQSKSSDPLFKEFEQKCAEDQRAAGLPLSSFLLKPMQRITKYPLLIQRVCCEDFTQVCSFQWLLSILYTKMAFETDKSVLFMEVS